MHVPEPPVPRPVAVLVPIRSFDGAKSRLGAVLDAEERRELVERLLRRTVQAARSTEGVVSVTVISPDPEVLDAAHAAGAESVLQQSRGLNPAIQEARQGLGAERLLVLPGDLPAVSPADLARLIEAGDAAGRPSVVLAPDRHGRGTNALLLDPPDAIDPAFGGDSRAAHAWLASSADIAFTELEGIAGLALDVDTPEDLLLAEPLLRQEAGRAD